MFIAPHKMSTFLSTAFMLNHILKFLAFFHLRIQAFFEGIIIKENVCLSFCICCNGKAAGQLRSQPGCKKWQKIGKPFCG